MKEPQKPTEMAPTTNSEKDHEIAKLIGDEIVLNRQRRNLTQKELSQLLNLSVQQIQKYEYGETNISVYRLIKIADALRTSVLNLLEPALKTYFQCHKGKYFVLHDPVDIEIITKINALSPDKKQALLNLLLD